MTNSEWSTCLARDQLSYIELFQILHHTNNRTTVKPKLNRPEYIEGIFLS